MRRALLAHRREQDVVGHNLANAKTPGYTRQEAVLGSTYPLYYPGVNRLEGAGQIGTGVVVEEIRRIRDAFVDKQLRIGTSSQGNIEIEKNTLRQIENVFLEPSSTEGLNDALSKFFNAWQELSKRPENTAVRINVNSTAQNLATVIHHIDQDLREIRSDLNTQLRKDVVEMNRITGQIAYLNNEIAKVVSVGDQPNDLMDQRDLLLDELAKYIEFTVSPTETGGVTVHVGGREILRDQYVYDFTDELMWDHPAQNTQTPQFTDISADDYKKLINFATGEIKGIVNSRDNILTDVQQTFTTLVQKIINEVNAKHVKGFGLNLADSTVYTPLANLTAGTGVLALNSTQGLSIGDTLRFEDDDGDAVSIKLLDINKVTNTIYFESVGTINSIETTKNARARKMPDYSNTFFTDNTPLPENFEGDYKPQYISFMTSAIDIPDYIDLTTKIGDLENIFGADIITNASLSLDDKATTDNIIDSNTTLQQVFDLINAANTPANDGAALEIKLDKVNHRITLSGNTDKALSQLGGKNGSTSNLFRILGFEGDGITGSKLVSGANLSSTLSDLGINSGKIMIDGVSIDINTNDTLRVTLNTINTALSNAGKKTNILFDIAGERLKLVSSNQFSTRLPITGIPSNFLSVTGLQRSTTVSQNSTIQNKSSVVSSDAGARMQVNPTIAGDINKIAAASAYSGIPGDNSVSIKIAQIKENLVLNDTASGTISQPTESIDDFYDSLVAKIGADSQQAITDSQVIDKFLEFYEKKREEVSGVSIDEELTRMIESQNAFNAAARMINVVDEMLDKIINGMGLVGR